MTTLPQTTPMRMPRVSLGGQLALPGVNGAGASAAPQAGAPLLTGGDIWRIIRGNWWLIALMLTASLVAGFFINSFLKKYASRYESTGLLMVRTPGEFTTGADVKDVDRQVLEIEQQSQAKLLLHPRLLMSVLEKADNPIRQTTWLRQFEKSGSNGQTVLDVAAAKDNLLDIFEVAPVANSRLISVTVRYNVPRDCRVIAEEIVNAHIKQQRDSVQSLWASRATAISNQRREIDTQHRALKTQLSQSAGSLTNDGLGPYGSSVKQLELSRYVEERAELEGKLARAETTLNGLKAIRDRGEVPPTADDLIQRDFRYNQHCQMVDDLRARIESEVAAGADSNQVKRLQKQLESYERLKQDRYEEARTNAMNSLLGEADSDVNALKSALDRIQSRVENLQKDTVQLSAAYASFKQLELDEQETREKLGKVDTQLAEIDKQRLPLEWSPIDWSPGSQPQTPELPSFPKLHWTLTAAGVVGLALALGIAFLRELTDTTVRSPRDVARVGNLSLLGMVPHEADDRQAAGARLPLVIFDAPHSMAAEEYRKLRTRLQHMASLDTTRSILVTGPSAGDGKTTVACNLAAGLALNGRRILLVDANFRRPELHKVFGLENARGFGDVLVTPQEFEDVVNETPVPNLSIMTAGARPGNATELLESQLLIDFIERALDDYDHVIFDSGAVLITSETLALAPRVDGVVTVVRARSNSRGVLQRTRDTLKQVKAEHLGVVLNAVRSQAGGYYGRSIVDYYKYQNGQPQ